MKKKTGAETKFIFIKSKDWKIIDQKMKFLHCLRCGIVKVKKDGVVILCAKSL